MPDIPRGHTSWLVTLSSGGRVLTVPWYQWSQDARVAYAPPTAATVLLGLLREAAGFYAAVDREQWAADHGFDDDDRGAWEAYGQLEVIVPALEDLLGARYAPLLDAAVQIATDGQAHGQAGAMAAAEPAHA